VSSLLKEDDVCLNIGLTLPKITSLPKSQLKLIKPRIHGNKEFVKLITIMESENVYESALHSDSNTFLTLFNGSISAYKIANFNTEPLAKVFLDTLSNNVKFNQFAMSIVSNDKLDTLQKSLLQVTPSLHVKSKTLFYLGLNALKYDEIDKANTFLPFQVNAPLKKKKKTKPSSGNI